MLRAAPGDKCSEAQHECYILAFFAYARQTLRRPYWLGSHALIVDGRYHKRVKNVGNKGGGSMVMTFKKGGVGFTRRRSAGFNRFQIEWS